MTTDFSTFTNVEKQALTKGTGGYLTLDLGALSANYLLLQKQAGEARVSAVVKADAYGIGADKVAPVLYQAGCRDFFVAHACEAFSLRPRLPADASLYVLNGLMPGTEAACADQNIIPVLNSADQIARWLELAASRGERLPAVLQFDTGMSRLGLSPEEREGLDCEAIKAHLDVRFLMSHLACADEPSHSANQGQLAVMREISAQFPNAAVSFANSGGLFLSPEFRYQLARPGVALYGGAPHDTRLNPMQPVVGLHVAVIQTRTVSAGTHIGYGGTYVAATEMRLATIAAGYADGLPRSLSPRGAAWFGDVRLPIVGRVSMDSIILDISALADGRLVAGRFVELIGPHQSLDAIAADAGTISYEILTSLGRRFHREYL
ncbi:Alanine racemase, biosynthetic (plasmid) [Asticcacaulis sp. MM231]|uniref:alanine racemase n=1 Tax=Asticcacaulis sp. MM231 TaxID=3157666 RepID=UPI0032D56B53